MNADDGCKLDRVVDAYDVPPQRSRYDDIHEELLARWTGDSHGDALGYRSLAEWFNKHLLSTVYEEEGRLALGARLEDEFETLTGDDEIARGELVDELSQEGIDAELLCDKMISFSTVRRHLTDCLDGEKDRQEAETDWEQNSVEIASDRLEEKVEKALSSHETKGRITGATEAGISIQVLLTCPECPTRRSLEEALRAGSVCEDHFPQNGE